MPIPTQRKPPVTAYITPEPQSLGKADTTNTILLSTWTPDPFLSRASSC